MVDTLLTQQEARASELVFTLITRTGRDPTDCAWIKSGTYTGDGTNSQGITGVGFQPKYVLITPRKTGDGNSIELMVYTTTDIVDDNAAGGAVDIKNGQFETNMIISLDADGFTVDANGSDQHPNKNTITYNYLAIG